MTERVEEILGYDVSEDGVATLTLDRPEKRNALNSALVDALRDGLRRAGEDDGVGVVVLRGAGPDFCSGADLAEMEAMMGAGPEENLRDARRLGDLFVEMRRHPNPIVGVVHGRALAGGCGLASACDIVLAHEDAEFGYPEVHLGFVPAMVMAILRRKVGEGRAFELVARGHRIQAAEAVRLGLVTRVFLASAFDVEVESYIGELAARPSSALTLSKRLLYGLDGVGFEDGIARGAEVNTLARSTEACIRGVERFLEKKRDG